MTKKKWMVAGIAGGILLLLIVYCVLCQTVENTTIWERTSVNGVSLEGKTVEEAADAVRARFREDYQDAALTVVLEDTEYSVPVFELLDIDASEQIQEAYALGHGPWITRGADWIRSRISPVNAGDLEVKPYVKNPEKLDEVLAGTGIEQYNSLVESSFEVSGTDLLIHKGRTGVAADTEQLKKEILAALEAGNFSDSIPCPTVERQLAAPDFQAIADSVAAAPSNATLDPANNYAVVAAVNGVSLDTALARAAYDSAAEGADVTVPLTLTAPEISTEDLEANLFRDVLGSYQSSATGSGGREHNIGLAVSLCSGVIVMPGETFSYNGVIGNTTLERGFQLANAYSNGEVVQEPGGGVCQVSSTLFSALLQTDIEIVQRRYHSMIVTYVPYGMDATVSWDQPDFRFRNNHKYPVKISMSFEGGVLRVQVLGTKESDLTVQCRVEQTGELDFVTYRDYYDAGGNLVNSEYITTSKYKPVS